MHVASGGAAGDRSQRQASRLHAPSRCATLKPFNHMGWAMSVEETRTIARRYFDEIVNERDDAATRELLAPDIVFHDPNAPGGTLHGRDSFAAFRAALVAAFPDFRMTVEDEIAEADKAVVRWMSRGTHRGDFYGLPPSGKQFAAPGIDIFALDGGQIREVWVALDALGMMQQLGAIPAAGDAGP